MSNKLRQEQRESILSGAVVDLPPRRRSGPRGAMVYQEVSEPQVRRALHSQALLDGLDARALEDIVDFLQGSARGLGVISRSGKVQRKREAYEVLAGILADAAKP